jgi:hypothetical protein
MLNSIMNYTIFKCAIPNSSDMLSHGLPRLTFSGRTSVRSPISVKACRGESSSPFGLACKRQISPLSLAKRLRSSNCAVETCSYTRKTAGPDNAVDTNGATILHFDAHVLSGYVMRAADLR